MADTVQDDLELKPADAGGMFRAEMFATQVLLGYWKHLVAVVVVVLVSILAWGQYNDWYRHSQRGATARIAQELAKLPAPLPALASQMGEGQTFDTAQIATVGDALVTIADQASGTAAVEARISAAEAYRLAGKPDQQRKALESAESAKGVLGYSVESALANLDLEEGKGDAAVERLRTLKDQQTGFLAEQAAIDLGLALEHLDRDDEAAKVYTEFVEKHPDSPRIESVRSRLKRVSSGAPVVPPGTPASPEGSP